MEKAEASVELNEFTMILMSKWIPLFKCQTKIAAVEERYD